jgi:quinoprotein glucose dehydrogenase
MIGIRMRRRVLLFILAITTMNSRTPDRQWPVYGGNYANEHYSPLSQITPANVRDLEVAWTYDTQDDYKGSEMQCNPLVIDGVLYATSPKLRVFALDAATGKELWSFRLLNGREISGSQRNRGLTYWASGSDRRLFVAAKQYLYALNAATGQPVPNFGVDGRIDLREGLGRPASELTVGLNTPGVIYKDLLIIGSIVPEGLPSSPGDIRAYDVRTGVLRWSFHTIPHPGQFGYETWSPDSWQKVGGANAWGGLTLDQQRGIVFAATGSAAFDFYGENRKGDNLFANTLLALDAATGKRIWHFQAVKHDVWDRDFPTAPALVSVDRKGQPVDAVAQITKSGHVFLFERETGKPLFPIQEVETPQDGAEEALPRKQLLPVKPPPFARQQLTETMLTRRTPEAHAAVLAEFRRLRSGPQFTPPSRQGTVIFPGYDGGGEWGGAAFDPKSKWLFVNSNEMAWILRLIPTGIGETADSVQWYARLCGSCHRADRKGSPPEFPSLLDIKTKLTEAQLRKVINDGKGRMPGFGSLPSEVRNAIVTYLLTEEVKQVTAAQNPYRQKFTTDGYNKFLDPEGYPAIAPPWGTLNAIDLNKGEIAWSLPFGEHPELRQSNTGSENYGGPVLTAGGVLFIGATNFDRKFHAYDPRNGKLLWEYTLPAAGNATPAIYQVNGQPFVVIAAGGGKSGAPSGGTYVAFTLRRNK